MTTAQYAAMHAQLEAQMAAELGVHGGGGGGGGEGQQDTAPQFDSPGGDAAAEAAHALGLAAATAETVIPASAAAAASTAASAGNGDGEVVDNPADPDPAAATPVASQGAIDRRAVRKSGGRAHPPWAAIKAEIASQSDLGKRLMHKIAKKEGLIVFLAEGNTLPFP